MRTIAVSGGFDIIHNGHIELIQKAREYGDRLVVILNSDRFLLEKKGYVAMTLEERKAVLEAIKGVDEVFVAIDKDNTVVESLRVLKPYIFANGGDRLEDNTPEVKVCEELGIGMIFGLGDKINSSSEIGNKIRKSGRE